MTSTPLRVGLVFGGASGEHAVSIRSAVTVLNTAWTVSIQYPGGWTPVWQAGVYAACVVIAVVLSAALFFFLLERRQHFDMLFAMLPPNVYRRVLAGSVARMRQ
jgi:hypothetical protein